MPSKGRIEFDFTTTHIGSIGNSTWKLQSPQEPYPFLIFSWVGVGSRWEVVP